MAEREISGELRTLVDQRVGLEDRLKAESGTMPERRVVEYEREYATLLRSLGQLFGRTSGEHDRTRIMLEMMRIMENKLVYLQNFFVEPTRDNQLLAALVIRFLEESAPASGALTHLETTYYRAIGALYAGDLASARQNFQAACESEESDEANDIKYKSYVILGNLSHEEKEYAAARELHDQSMRYAQNDNVTAQALAFKALNSYALGDRDGALELFEDSLTRFDRTGPFFNSYFHRNALLFCGSIQFQRKNYARAEECYRTVLEDAEPSSYDRFDALTQLGKIAYASGRLDDAVGSFRQAIDDSRVGDNEHVVDTCFWLARAYLKKGNEAEARTLLQRVAGSDVQSDRRSQAAQLLAQVG